MYRIFIYNTFFKNLIDNELSFAKFMYLIYNLKNLYNQSNSIQIFLQQIGLNKDGEDLIKNN